MYARACWAVTSGSKATPSFSAAAANRSSSQFVITPSRKRVASRASASAESGNAGQSATAAPNAARSSAVGVKPSSSATPSSPSATTSRYVRYGPASAAASWRA